MESDSNIVERYQAGEENAFDLLVAKYTKPIYNFVYRLGGREESRDLTQEIFVKVWKNLSHFDVNKSFKAWIFSIARNAVIDWLRKKKDYRFSELDREESAFEETLADLEPLPDEIFEKKEIKAALEKALEKISTDQKTIIILHHTEGLTFEEIADILSKPMNTIKSQYRRALIALRNILLE